MGKTFRNTDATVVIGNFPWYEMVWRSLRGDFRPTAPPACGYEAFARRWSIPVDLARIHARQREPVVTWLGHATILLQVGGLNILLDPTLAEFAGPYGRVGAPRRVPAPLHPRDLPPIDAVLVTHNHYDHLCQATVKALVEAGQRPRFYVPLGLKRWFDARKIAPVTELDWWESAEVTLTDDEPSVHEGLRVFLTPSQHWSRRTPFNTNASLWGGYLLEWRAEGRAPWRFMFPGDTGYSADFRTIRERLGPVDFLALPIGAYRPREFMKRMHVNPADAVRLMLDLEAAQAMAVHWGTFMLTQEPFDQPPKDLAEALREHGLPAESVWLMRHGETRMIPI
jgi:N-acyl-phosphatidylethanolamine-hydrolysing phospholipase D